MKWFVYILLCSDGTYYCGCTNNLERRLKAHNDGKGAKYTRGRRPVRLVHQECFPTKGLAMRREIRIKKMPRRDKVQLVEEESLSEG